jgi:hypothetical protein
MNKTPRSRHLRSLDWGTLASLFAFPCVALVLFVTAQWGFLPLAVVAIAVVIAAITMLVLETSPRPGKRISRSPLEKRASILSNLITISDPWGCFLFFGLLCFYIGAFTIMIAFGVGPLPHCQVLLASFMATVEVATGLYIFYQSGGSQVQVDVPNRRLRIIRRGLPRLRHEAYDFSAIRSVYLLQGKDFHGYVVFTIRMQLQDGREVPLTLLWFYESEHLAILLAQLVPYITQGETRVEN